MASWGGTERRATAADRRGRLREYSIGRRATDIYSALQGRIRQAVDTGPRTNGDLTRSGDTTPGR